MADDKRRNPDPRGKLRLHLTPPVYDQNTGAWQATVRANLHAGAQSSGAKLYFRVDGAPVVQKETDQGGSTSMKCSDLTVGEHGVEVRSSTGAFQTLSFEIAPKLQLELGEPDETKSDNLSLSASALVSIDGRPVEGISVQFFRDEKSYKNPQPTDANGRAEMAFLKLIERRYVFSAQLQGTTIRARQSLAVTRKQDLRQITLEVTEPSVDPDTKELQVTAIAGVSLHQRPLQDVTVDFCVDRTCVLAGQKTDSDGRARAGIFLETQRGYLVEAAIAGTTIRASKSLNVSARTMRKPATINVVLVELSESRAYRLFISVLDGNGNGVPDQSVLVVDLVADSASPDGVVGQGKTDEYGMYVLRVCDVHQNRVVDVLACGTALSRRVQLLAPRGSRRVDRSLTIPPMLPPCSV
jgi:hypothetical protein